MKQKIINILRIEKDPSVRFEVLEKYLEFIDSEEDVRFLIKILFDDADPCVRHKAAAQLFRIEEKDIDLPKNLKSEIIHALLDRALNDESTVVRHESIEALGYLGDESALNSLKKLTIDENLDVRSTAIIALGTASKRVEFNLEVNQVSDFLIANSSL